jgi:hypothetical protein
VKRLTDIGMTVVVLFVLLGILIAINPRMREQAGQFSGSVQSQSWDPAGSPVGNATLVFVNVISTFATDNPFMFSFAVVAAVLFMVMIKTL